VDAMPVADVAAVVLVVVVVAVPRRVARRSGSP